MNEHFKTLLNFPGWGSPKDSIWFVGIEDASDWSFCNFYNSTIKHNNCNVEDYKKNYFEEEFEEAINKYKPDINGIKHFNWSDSDKKYRYPLYDQISKICCYVFDIQEVEDYAFRNELLCQNKIEKISDENIKKKFLNLNNNVLNTFLINLYPLAVTNSSPLAWKKLFREYKEYFSLEENFIDKDKYQTSCLNFRKEILSELIKKNKPHIVVCFGKDFSPEFINIFKINEKINHNLKKVRNRYFNYYENNDKIFFIINHLSWPQPDEYLKEIGFMIRSFIKTFPILIAP